MVVIYCVGIACDMDVQIFQVELNLLVKEFPYIIKLLLVVANVAKRIAKLLIKVLFV